MGKNAKEEKLIYERPKLVELDTPSTSGNNQACGFGSLLDFPKSPHAFGA